MRLPFSLEMKSFARLLLPVMLCLAVGQCSSWRSALSTVDLDTGIQDAASPSYFHIQMNPGANTTTVTPQFFPEHGSKRVQMRYGPFSVQSMNENNGMVDYLQIGAKLPCDNCTITYIHANLEYPDGSYANANTSLWMHHILFINLGEADTVCGKNYYGRGQRWFASGNERTPADLSLSGTMPVGYYVDKGVWNVLVIELMNQAMQEQQAVVEVTFEYIDGLPSSFYQSRPIWLDIAGCDTESEMPPKSNTTFEYTAPNYKSDFSGAITGMGGHLHDGGTHLEITKNNKIQCNSIAYYGQTPGYWDAKGTSMTMVGSNMPDGSSPMEHISSISSCHAPTSMINSGEDWTINAYYNFTEYAPMLNTDGTTADIMGISVIYVAENMTQPEMISLVGDNVAPLAILPALGAAAAPTISGAMPMPSSNNAMDMNGSDNQEDGDDDEGFPTCVPPRDSPGTLSSTGLDLNDYDVGMNYLMKILDDACMRGWSNNYARDFWYGIVAVIGLFVVRRLGSWATISLSLRNAAAGRANSSFFLLGLPKLFRVVSYPQYTSSGLDRFFRAPNLGSAIMIVAYVGFLLALEFTNVDTGDDQRWQSMSVRAGWLSVTQLPLIILLANKRNFVGFFTGVTYERLNTLHRWTARGLLLTATFHFGFQGYGWSRLGLFKLEWDSDECIGTGLAAYVLVLWMNVSTLAPIRNLWYEFFVVQHIITFIGTIIAIAYHIPNTATYARTYIYVASGLYLASKLIQALYYAYNNIRPSRASITRISDRVVKIDINHRAIKSWSPGSFVLISIPRYGFMQSHPATIASDSTSKDGKLSFYMLGRGGFTEKISKESAQSSEHLALIDGPYGGQQADFAGYRAIVLIAGSTGISFTLSILRNLAVRASNTRLPVQEIAFVWATKEEEFADALKDELADAVQALSAAGVNVSMRVHVTGRPAAISTEDHSTREVHHIEDEKKEHMEATATEVDSSSSSPARSTTGSALETLWGRPDLHATLEAAKASCAGAEMGVAVCGPLSMSMAVRNRVARMQKGGGVHLHVEGFAW